MEDFRDLTEAHIAPVLAAAGFGPGHYEARSALFCAAYDDVCASFPWLPQVGQQHQGVGECTDLMIELDEQGHLVRADLETLTIASSLLRCGAGDAAAKVIGLGDAPPGTTIPALAEALRVLLRC